MRAGGLSGVRKAEGFLRTGIAIQIRQPRRKPVATKAEQLYDEVQALIGSGVERSEAFKQIAESHNRSLDGVRGSYYSHKRKLEGGTPTRSRRRETTPADAVGLATTALRKAIESIDREIEAAEERASEAAAEAEALKDSAAERKAEIEAKITALEA
jgi:dsDNA-specific endonuclease/ATPase MutS2